MLFVYDKKDIRESETAQLDFLSCSFISQERTADFTTTFRLRQMVSDGANEQDIVGFLIDKNIPADEITLYQIATQVLETPPEIGYLTISNALQWRLQYQRIVSLTQEVSGIIKILDKVNVI